MNNCERFAEVRGLDGGLVHPQTVPRDHRGRQVVSRRLWETSEGCRGRAAAGEPRPRAPVRPRRRTEGDVRGVLEIIRPLDQDVKRTRQGLRGTYVLMISSFLLLLGASMFVLVVGNKRRSR